MGRDGGTFAYGDYPFPGSLAGIKLNAPVVAATPFNGSTGVWLLGADGGVFALNAPFYGAATGEANPPPPAAPGAPVGGGNGGLVLVTCPDKLGSIKVAATLGPALTRLLADANAQGVKLCGSGWRSSADQITLRKKYCGTSNDAIYNWDPARCRVKTAKPGPRCTNAGWRSTSPRRQAMRG